MVAQSYKNKSIAEKEELIRRFQQKNGIKKRDRQKMSKTKVCIICGAVAFVAVGLIVASITNAAYERNPKDIILSNGVTISKYRIASSTACGDNLNCSTTEIGWVEIKATITNNSDEDIAPYNVSAYFDIYRRDSLFGKKEYLGTCKVSNRRIIKSGDYTYAVDTSGCAIMISPDESINKYIVTPRPETDR